MKGQSHRQSLLNITTTVASENNLPLLHINYFRCFNLCCCNFTFNQPSLNLINIVYDFIVHPFCYKSFYLFNNFLSSVSLQQQFRNTYIQSISNPYLNIEKLWLYLYSIFKNILVDFFLNSILT